MHCQVMFPLTSTSDKLTINLHKIYLPSKVGLVPVSKTFRPERGQKCFLQQISLDRTAWCHPCFTSFFLSQEQVASLRQCWPSTTTLPLPGGASPIQMSSHRQIHNTRCTLPCSLPGSSSTVCKTRGTSQQCAGQKLQPQEMKPVSAWLASPLLKASSLLWHKRASSTNCGREAFLSQEPVPGWVESSYSQSRKYPVQSLGRSTEGLHAGPQAGLQAPHTQWQKATPALGLS